MTDELDAALRDMQRQQRRRKRLLYGGIAVVGLAPFLLMAHGMYARWREARADILDAPKAGELRALLGRLNADSAACRDAWGRQTRSEAIASIRLGGAACPIRLEAPTFQAAQSYVQLGSIDGNYFGSWPLRIVAPGADVGDPAACPPDGLPDVQARLERDEATLTDLAYARDVARGRERREVVVLAAEQQPGMFLKEGIAAGSFAPGLVRGRALLYSHAEQRFVCGAEIEARNSPTLDVRFTHMKGNPVDRVGAMANASTAAIQRDLQVQLRRKVAGGLALLATP